MNGKFAWPNLQLVATLIGLLLCFSSSCIASEKRIALVIGNSDYASTVGGKLTNPVKDADLVAQALQSDGFDVVVLKNASRSAMLSAVSEYSLKLSEQKDEVIGFLYYSGHGMSRPGTDSNYLLPIDITDLSKPDVWFDAISLDSLLRELSVRAPNATHFAVFDACRSVLRVPYKSQEKGFSRPAEIPGMFIAFSTSPQSVASDEGENGGPYAKILSSELRVPNIDHLKMFQEVKQRVFDLTHGSQRPWDSNDLLQNVYFSPTAGTESSSSSNISPSSAKVPGMIEAPGATLQIKGKDETFCPDLKAALDMTAQEFASLRRGPGTIFGWSTEAKLSGYQNCMVMKGDRISLSCDSTPVPSKDAAQKLMARYGDRAGSCLGGEWQKSDAGGIGAIFLNNFSSGNSIIISTRDEFTIDGRKLYKVNLNIYNSATSNKSTATAASLPPPQKPTDYCNDLKSVAAEGDHQFGAILGRKSQYGGWQSRVQLNGWEECEISAFDEGKERKYFGCELSPVPTGEAVDQMVADIAVDVKACLGGSWYPKRRVSNKGRLVIEFWSNDVTSSVEVRSSEKFDHSWQVKLDVDGAEQVGDTK